MVFSYYQRLNAAQKKIYRRSDQLTTMPIPHGIELRTTLLALQQSLTAGEAVLVQQNSQVMCQLLTDGYKTPPVHVQVFDTRPHDENEELHGLYEPAESAKPAQISVWMRTARRKQIVAYRTFVRTVLHELCHHLDYELLKLEESFHTEGFYQREADLYQQLMLQLA